MNDNILESSYKSSRKKKQLQTFLIYLISKIFFLNKYESNYIL